MPISQRKRWFYAACAGIGIAAGAAGVASAATSDGTGSGNADQEQNDDAASYQSSVTVGANIAEHDTAALAAVAKISAAEAQAKALAAVPGTAGKTELDNENGNVTYNVEVQTASGTVDVKVDAGNGAILAQEGDDHEGDREAGDDEANDTPDANDKSDVNETSDSNN